MKKLKDEKGKIKNDKENLRQLLKQKESNYINSEKRFNDLNKTYLDLVFNHQKLEGEYKNLKANQLSNNSDNNSENEANDDECIVLEDDELDLSIKF